MIIYNKVMVSVWITAYNHKKYIAKALDSALMQKTNFKYEIVIGEDCSTDGTRDILVEYQNKYPDKIKLLLHKKNLGQMKNAIETWHVCQGKYVAMLDSDDYWQDSLKLQKQVNFLEKNSEYAISYHDSKRIDENDIITSNTCGYRKDYSKDELICGIATMPTSATVIRNMKLDFPDYFSNSYQPDTIICHYAGLKGKAKFQDDIKNSAYRIHITGIWSGIDLTKRVSTSVETRRLLKRNVANDLKLMHKIEDSIVQSYLEYLFTFLRALDFKSYVGLVAVIYEDKQTSLMKVLGMHVIDIVKRFISKAFKVMGIKNK